MPMICLHCVVVATQQLRKRGRCPDAALAVGTKCDRRNTSYAPIGQIENIHQLYEFVTVAPVSIELELGAASPKVFVAMGVVERTRERLKQHPVRIEAHQ